MIRIDLYEFGAQAPTSKEFTEFVPQIIATDSRCHTSRQAQLLSMKGDVGGSPARQPSVGKTVPEQFAEADHLDGLIDQRTQYSAGRRSELSL